MNSVKLNVVSFDVKVVRESASSSSNRSVTPTAQPIPIDYCQINAQLRAQVAFLTAALAAAGITLPAASESLPTHREVLAEELSPFLTLNLPEGTYCGQIKNGKRHGYGTMTYTDGRTYRGNWVDGNREGQGYMSFADGTTFNGKWIQNRRQEGVMVYSNGARYEGPFPIAQGENCKYRWPDNSRYEGESRDVVVKSRHLNLLGFHFERQYTIHNPNGSTREVNFLNFPDFLWDRNYVSLC